MHLMFNEKSLASLRANNYPHLMRYLHKTPIYICRHGNQGANARILAAASTLRSNLNEAISSDKTFWDKADLDIAMLELALSRLLCASMPTDETALFLFSSNIMCISYHVAKSDDILKSLDIYKNTIEYELIMTVAKAGAVRLQYPSPTLRGNVVVLIERSNIPALETNHCTSRSDVIALSIESIKRTSLFFSNYAKDPIWDEPILQSSSSSKKKKMNEKLVAEALARHNASTLLLPAAMMALLEYERSSAAPTFFDLALSLIGSWLMLFIMDAIRKVIITIPFEAILRRWKGDSLTADPKIQNRLDLVCTITNIIVVALVMYVLWAAWW